MLLKAISDLGIGAIIGAVLGIILQYFLSERSKRKTISFQEKKDAFVGLLESYRNCAIDGSGQSQKDFSYWHIRCQLVANCEINDNIRALKLSSAGSNERTIFEKNLVNSMRSELKRYM